MFDRITFDPNIMGGRMHSWDEDSRVADRPAGEAH
jgi:hypothetical protein